MGERRGQVTLATKLSARKADDARRQIELSLKRLQTDRLDVLHIHALSGPEDLAAIEAPDGVLKALYEARDQKVTRAIGITCHAAPAALRRRWSGTTSTAPRWPSTRRVPGWPRARGG